MIESQCETTKTKHGNLVFRGIHEVLLSKIKSSTMY